MIKRGACGKKDISSCDKPARARVIRWAVPKDVILAVTVEVPNIPVIREQTASRPASSINKRGAAREKNVCPRH
jgi:hypothetical protein